MHYLIGPDGALAGGFVQPQPDNPLVVELPDDDPRVVAFHARLAAEAAPTSCSKLGLKRAFAELGIWPQVRAMIAADEDMQEEWDLAVELKVSDPIVRKAVAGLRAADLITADAQVVGLITRANELVA